MKTIGFIGAGNMGGAMAKACAKIAENKVWVYDENPLAYQAFEEEKNIVSAANVEDLMAKCDYVVLSVKPQYYDIVGQTIKNIIAPYHIVITVAPSYSLEDMEKLLGSEVKVIRTMPNTPALVGEGVTAYCYKQSKIEKILIEDFICYFSSFGKLVEVEEHLMPAVVAAAGSSPAYVYMFIEAMADAAVSFGMPRKMAYEMIGQVVKGSAEMVLETKKHPGDLKDAVTSPGGTTIKAVLKMEQAGFRNSVIKGMEACYNQVIHMASNK